MERMYWGMGKLSLKQTIKGLFSKEQRYVSIVVLSEISNWNCESEKCVSLFMEHVLRISNSGDTHALVGKWK